jgi:ankyrin repeat protein
VSPLVAASGVGYGEGFAGNTHNVAPPGMMAGVKYLVEELGADVNAVDHEGNTAMHNAAARGDVEMILYLVAKGADPKAVNREGKTTSGHAERAGAADSAVAGGAGAGGEAGGGE